jgi:hypothetical protein
MISIGVSTNAEGVARVLAFEARGLRDWSRRDSDGGPSGFERFHRVFLASRRRMFSTNNASEGAMWVSPLDTAERDAYIYAKSAIAGIPLALIPALVLRWPPYNRLQKSLTLAGHPDHVARISADAAEFGTRTPWAYANHTGTGVAPKGLGGHRTPRRPLLDIGTQTEMEYRDQAVLYAAKRVEDTIDRLSGAEALAMRRAGRA